MNTNVAAIPQSANAIAANNIFIGSAQKKEGRRVVV